LAHVVTLVSLLFKYIVEKYYYKMFFKTVLGVFSQTLSGNP